MVEHLGLVAQFSTGKRTTHIQKSEVTAKKWKQVLIYTDFQMKPGVKAPFLPKNQLIDLLTPDFETAKEFLFRN